MERALGILWSIETDCFRFFFCLKDQPATQRGILSTVTSLYDPLGFVAPFLLTGKRVLQETCRNGTGWNDSLISELQPVWQQWKDNLVNLEKMNIPCWHVPTDFGRVLKESYTTFLMQAHTRMATVLI